MICVSICRSIYLSIDRSVSLFPDVFMDLAMHRCVYVSIDLITRLSIDLASKSHCTYPLLCFQNRCLPELPLRYFPSSADGCMIGVGETKRMQNPDATRMGQKKFHHASVPTTTLVLFEMIGRGHFQFGLMTVA